MTQEEKNNIDVYKRVAPGVVNITSIAFEYDFFLRPIPREGAGSGMVLDKKGHILTNNHVIRDARRLEVTLPDGSKWPGTLVGTYPEFDIAVIQIKAPAKVLHPVLLGNSSNLVVGQKVLAIGNPFGLGQTLTTGVISSLGRSIKSTQNVLMEDLIQTDASINPGNSGGPLLDSDGRIIGINTAILSPTGASVGIGFAVPVDAVKRFAPELIEKGYVAYPWMGIRVFPLIKGLGEALDIDVEQGVIVVEIVGGGPADTAGLRGPKRAIQIGNYLLPAGGDVIVEIDGKRIASTEDFIRNLRNRRPGETATLKILRDGKYITKHVLLGEKPRQLME